MAMVPFDRMTADHDQSIALLTAVGRDGEIFDQRQQIAIGLTAQLSVDQHGQRADGVGTVAVGLVDQQQMSAAALPQQIGDRGRQSCAAAATSGKFISRAGRTRQ